MQPRYSSLAIHGAIGGVIAGAVVMGWFFVLDVLASQPLATPTVLASMLLDRDIVHATFGVVAGYTILHFGVFVVLGVLAAFGLQVSGVVPGLRHGVVYGLGVLNAVHYGAFLATDAQMLTVLPTGHVLAANLLGGMGLMAYLHRAQHAESPLGLGVLMARPFLRQSIGTGFVGAGTVALWFLLLDLFAGQPFFTPAALGSAVFLGASSPAEVETTIGLVASYTVLHLAAFIFVGAILVWVSERIVHTPGLWMLALLGFITVEAGFLGLAGMLGGWVLGAVGFLAVVGGNLLSVAAMARWIWVTHPGLREKLVEQPVTTLV